MSSKYVAPRRQHFINFAYTEEKILFSHYTQICQVNIPKHITFFFVLKFCH